MNSLPSMVMIAKINIHSVMRMQQEKFSGKGKSCSKMSKHRKSKSSGLPTITRQIRNPKLVILLIISAYLGLLSGMIHGILETSGYSYHIPFIGREGDAIDTSPTPTELLARESGPKGAS